PTEAKYGMSLDTLIQAYTQLRAVKISSFGLHTMVASNELNPDYFADTAHLLLDAVETVERKASITIDFINLGGGFGLNYAVDQAPLDVEDAAAKIKVAIQEHSKKDLRIFTENGRFVTGSAGFLLTRVRYVMQKHKTYVGVDASM